MSASILVGYDPRAGVRAPIDFGIILARLTGAKLIVAAVQASAPKPPRTVGPAVLSGPGRIDEDVFAEALEQAAPELHAYGIAYECRRLDGSSAAHALREAAQEDDVALLVVGGGRHPRLGSTAQRLLHGAPCPVVTVPREYELCPLRTVAAAAARDDQEVVASAHALAARAGALLRVITVVPVTASMYVMTESSTGIRAARDVEAIEGERRALAERDLRRAVAVAGFGDEVPIDVSAFIGDPADQLIELSPRFDVLVCGSCGCGSVRAVLLGSVSHRLAAEAHCPVLVLPHGVTAPLEELVLGGHAVA